MTAKTSQRIPSAQRKTYQLAFQNGKDKKARELAEKLTGSYQDDPFGWHSLGAVCFRLNELEPALAATQKARELESKPKPDTLRLLGKIHFALNQLKEAEDALSKAVALNAGDADSHLMLGHTYHAQLREAESIEALDQAYVLAPDNPNILAMRIVVLSKAKRYAGVMEDCERLIALKPQKASFYNLVGSKYNEVGEFAKARYYFQEALKRDPAYFGAASNEFTTLHYDPDISAETIHSTILQWQPRFAPEPATAPLPANTDPGKRLRVGMLSSGFRIHPVGQMIQAGVLNLKRVNIELIYYTLDRKTDVVSKQLMRSASQWKEVYKKDNDELEALLRGDDLDILIDLSGHNDGNRLPVIARKPAPLIVKWVGGQINTMGLDAIDYFLSDKIETPPGADKWYVEKLIRLPDDYICYTTPYYIPPITPLPALSNGYITLGCLNNPTKINKELLIHWSELMQALPNSRLLLKSAQYEDASFCQRIRQTLEEQGISRDRVMLEGPENHKAFLETYQRIDIALDPWPYSGGLTTCEALAMGVPVVTMPGPTFAGRHAASHLVNAGLPELVTDSWESYRQCVIGLAEDLSSLAVIRAGLREQMARSPLCNGKRFAENFDGAMRAIWQRYSQGKTPAALTFQEQGQCIFDDEDTPVRLQHPTSYNIQKQAPPAFNWQLSGRIVTLDNSSKLLMQEGFARLRAMNAFSVIAFDPASRVQNPTQFEGNSDVQLFPHAVLGDGTPTTLYACLEPEMSSTVKPLPSTLLSETNKSGPTVLTELPVNTIALNSIKGLASLDWLILDNLCDAYSILENGDKALTDALLIQVHVAFQPTHENQPSLNDVQQWMANHGFRLYRFNRLVHTSCLPADVPENLRQASNLTSAEVLFIPSQERIRQLDNKQCTKLAFLLHTIYGAKDLTYELLNRMDKKNAKIYLQEQGLSIGPNEATVKGARSSSSPPIKVSKPKEEATPAPASSSEGFAVPDMPRMSESETKLLLNSLSVAKQYFEYGSGGSTVLAVKQGLTVQGVESDEKWVNGLKNKLGAKCQVSTVNIGPTGAWGFPVSKALQKNFPLYSLAINKHKAPFDLILVDGRFRVACTLTAIKHILHRHEDAEVARIFIHDFWNRPHYHVVLQFLSQVESVESAGLFKVRSDIDLAQLEDVWERYSCQPA